MGASYSCTDGSPRGSRARCTDFQCSSFHCNALHCTAPHCTALHRTALHRAAMLSTALHRTALHRTAMLSTAPHRTTLGGGAPDRWARHSQSTPLPGASSASRSAPPVDLLGRPRVDRTSHQACSAARRKHRSRVRGWVLQRHQAELRAGRRAGGQVSGRCCPRHKHDDARAGHRNGGADEVPLVGRRAVDGPPPHECEQDEDAAVGSVGAREAGVLGVGAGG